MLTGNRMWFCKIKPKAAGDKLILAHFPCSKWEVGTREHRPITSAFSKLVSNFKEANKKLISVEENEKLLKDLENHQRILLIKLNYLDLQKKYPSRDTVSLKADRRRRRPCWRRQRPPACPPGRTASWNCPRTSCRVHRSPQPETGKAKKELDQRRVLFVSMGNFPAPWCESAISVRIRIRSRRDESLRIHADPDTQHWHEVPATNNN